jgi:hypothetical protein
MSVLNVFDQRYRGFRVIEIGGVVVLLALILLVYLAKTIAGSESAQIDHVQQQIGSERARVTLLRAEVASLEQPERLETLSGKYLGLQPVDAKHDIDAQALATISGAPAPKPPQPAADATPQAATPTPAAPPVAVAVAAQPDATKPAVAKPVKVAAITPKPAKPTKVAAAQPVTEAAAEPPARRPSELKPPAADPIGVLVQAAPDGPAEAPR